MKEDIEPPFTIKKGYEEVVEAIFEDDRSTSRDSSFLNESNILQTNKSIYLSPQSKKSNDESEFLPSEQEWNNLILQQDLLVEDFPVINASADEQYPEDSSNSSDDDHMGLLDA